MIARDGDRVELWHLLRGELEDVCDDPHRRFRRINIGVPHHVFLENVILDGACELFQRGSLFKRCDDVECEDGQHRAVHGHGDGDLIERDTIEEQFHIQNRVDGHARLADITDDTRVVRVVTAVSSQVEGDRQSLLAGR